MRLFGRKAATKEDRPRREPAQVAQIVPGIVAQIWSALRENGQRLDWSIARARKESDGEGAPYRTFRPKDLPACVKALAFLSEGFAECALIENGTRSRLALLSGLLQEALADFEQSEKQEAEDFGGNGSAAPLLKLGA